MPAQPFDNYNSAHRPNQSSVHLTAYDEDSKAPYDDLIDEYAAPYASNTTHQTYNLPLSPSQHQQHHRRGPSFPLSQKLSYSKQSEDTATDFSHNAYPPPPVEVVSKPSIWRRLIPESMACRLYLLVLLIETLVDLAVEADLLVRVLHETDHEQNAKAVQKITIYLILFSLGHVFQLVLALDAVYHRNTLQFICLTLFNTALLGYSIVQIGEVNETVGLTNSGVSQIPIKVLTIIIPCVIGVSTLAYIALGFKIYHEFGWKVYKFLGADRRIKKMYANYQIYECLIKFDVFFWAGFSIQFICFILESSDWEYWVTVAALPLSLLLLWEGHLAARHEGKWMMASFLSGCVGAMVYFCYKLVKVLMYKDSDYAFTWKSLTIFSTIAILLLLLTFVFAIMTMRNFGRGLKDALSREGTAHESNWSKNPNGATKNRMSII